MPPRAELLRPGGRRSPPTACRHTVSGTISLPSQGFFSPFPHGTGSLSVASEYLASRDGPRSFPQGFSCPAVLRYPLRVRPISPTWLSHSSAGLSRSVQLSCGLVTLLVVGPTTPGYPCGRPGLGCSDFARRYFRNRGCFLFLRVLRWFTSPGSPRRPMDSGGDVPVLPGRVSPFGDLRVTGCLRLTGAYRSLPRPSSPACAKASTVRP